MSVHSVPGTPRPTERAKIVSVLRRGDEDMHYSDNSHRWIAPPDVDQSAWDAGLRAHLSQHLSTIGGPAKSEELRPPHLPHPHNRRASEPKGAAVTRPTANTVPARRAATAMPTRKAATAVPKGAAA